MSKIYVNIQTALLLALSLFAGVATGSTLKTWTAGETIDAADLNANFSHLHSNLGRGHGAVIQNSDIKATAAISLSKLAGGVGIFPKAWAFNEGCATPGVAGTTCGTMNAQTNVLAITQSGVSGSVNVYLNYLPTDSKFIVLVTTDSASSVCYVSDKNIGTLYPTTTTPQFKVRCTDLAGVAQTAMPFLNILVMDNT